MHQHWSISYMKVPRQGKMVTITGVGEGRGTWEMSVLSVQFRKSKTALQNLLNLRKPYEDSTLLTNSKEEWQAG